MTKNKANCGCSQTTKQSDLKTKSLLAADGATYGYDSRGRLQKVTFSNGTTHLYNYDSMGNRTSVVTMCPGGSC